MLAAAQKNPRGENRPPLVMTSLPGDDITQETGHKRDTLVKPHPEVNTGHAITPFTLPAMSGCCRLNIHPSIHPLFKRYFYTIPIAGVLLMVLT